MENMDKVLTVPKWVLIVRPKIPQMPQNLSAQFVCQSPKVLDFNEKRLYWASVVRENEQHQQVFQHSFNEQKVVLLVDNICFCYFSFAFTLGHC